MALPSHLQPKPSSALASLSLMPSNIKFANQNEGEQIVLFIRQHKVILIGYFVKFIINLLIPIVVYLLVSFVLSQPFVKDFTFRIRDSYILALYVVWYLWSFTRFFSDFLYWFYNGYIITSQRLIDLDFISVLKHSIKELDLKNIEDAVDTHDGVLQTVFDMGRVVIRTASESTTFSLDNVPDSSKVRDFIMDLSIYNSGKNEK